MAWLLPIDAISPSTDLRSLHPLPAPSDPGKGGGMIRPLGYWRNAAAVSGGQQDKAGGGPLALAQPTGREAEQIHRSCNCLDLRTTATQGSEFFPGSHIAKPREQECLADRQGTEAQEARPAWGQRRSRAELGGNPRQPPMPPLSPPPRPPCCVTRTSTGPGSVTVLLLEPCTS